MENLVTIFGTVFVMLGFFWLYERDQNQKREIKALKEENQVSKEANLRLSVEVESLRSENQKLMNANRKNLPYNTAEELEHLLATVIVLEKDIEIKSNLVGNIRAHAELARENKRAGATA